MEWTFGLTTSSDELQEIGSPYLQLKLILETRDHRLIHEHLELSIQQFYTFLAQMEACQSLL